MSGRVTSSRPCAERRKKADGAIERREIRGESHVNLATLDLAILGIYAVGIFLLAQWVSREKGAHEKNAQY